MKEEDGPPVRRAAMAAAAAAGVALALALAPAAHGADAAGTAPPAPPFVVSGTVPDDATRQALLARSREAFGAARTVDRVVVGSLAAPPGWTAQLRRLVAADLVQISRGRLELRGSTVELHGEVASEAVRQRVLDDVRGRIDVGYTLRDDLRVAAGGQAQIDRLLADRTIEFETGNATLTAAGRQLLDLLVPVLRGSAGRGVEVTGHTDAQGARAQNLALSAARADAVKSYLVGSGLAAGRIAASGAGPDRPVAANDTPAGRARNRRIELRVLP